MTTAVRFDSVSYANDILEIAFTPIVDGVERANRSISINVDDFEIADFNMDWVQLIYLVVAAAKAQGLNISNASNFINGKTVTLNLGAAKIVDIV